MRTFYLVTDADGYLFFADKPASAGAVLEAIDVPRFSRGGLFAATKPAGALRYKHDWPYALWEVTGTPAGKQPDSKILRRFTTLTVLRAVEPALALGPCHEQLTEFFDSIAALRASDLRKCPSVQDDWSAAVYDPENLCPPADKLSYRAKCDAAGPQQGRANDLADRGELGAARVIAANQAEKLADGVMAQLCPVSRPDRVLHLELSAKLLSACGGRFGAVDALIVSDRLDSDAFAAMTENWRRITGQTLTPAPARTPRRRNAASSS